MVNKKRNRLGCEVTTSRTQERLRNHHQREGERETRVKQNLIRDDLQYIQLLILASNGHSVSFTISLLPTVLLPLLFKGGRSHTLYIFMFWVYSWSTPSFNYLAVKDLYSYLQLEKRSRVTDCSKFWSKINLYWTTSFLMTTKKKKRRVMTMMMCVASRT